MLKVAFQGEPGAYSQAAAVSFFKESIETIPYPTFYEALDSTENGRSDYTILPVENIISYVCIILKKSLQYILIHRHLVIVENSYKAII